MSENALLAFGWQLYMQLLKSGALSSTAGAFFSPLSVYLALVLVLNGAGPLSQTQRQLWDALTGSSLGNTTMPALLQAEAAFNNQTVGLVNALLAQSGSTGTELGIANGIWAKELPVSKEYADAMWRLYRTPVQEVNSTDPINKWAKDKTGGLITQAVPASLKFNLLLTNAVYFRAVWEYAFDPDATMDQDFNTYVNGSKQVVSVKMMYKAFRPSEMTGTPVLYGRMPGRFRAVKLPYKGSTIAAYAVLPDAAFYNNSVDAAAAGIRPEMLFNATYWKTVYHVGNRLEVLLPRFKIPTDQVSLKQALKALNISAAFSPNAADFSRMSEYPLFISDVLQSTVVVVDEKGTEAAAVTTATMVTTSYMEDQAPPMVFDRPFIFLIVDEPQPGARTVLFQGTVKDPSKSV